MSLAGKLTVVFVLILANGFFAMSELAIVSARRVRLKQLAEDGRRGASLALRMAEDPGSFLSIVQTGMTLNSVLAGAFSGAELSDQLGAYLNHISWIAPDGAFVALAITVSSVTYLNLVIGELIPKRIGLSYAVPIAVRVSFVMHIIAVAGAPFIWFIKQSTNIVLRVLRLENPHDTTVTEEEVKDIIVEGMQSGAIKPAERHMLEGVMRLSDRTVRMVMTPRIDLVWLSVDATPQEQQNIIRSSGYSRFPVARGDLEEIVGFVHAKDILNATFDGESPAIRAVMRPALTIPDTTTVIRLLDQFKQSGQHIAIVVDEYGSVEGLVSITDILQAITGMLPEDGQDGTTAKPVRREDGSWLIDGLIPLDEVEALVDLKNMRGDGEFHTLGGFIVDRLGRLPTTGDHFVWDDVRFEVVDMDGRRVDKVLITPPPETETKSE